MVKLAITRRQASPKPNDVPSCELSEIAWDLLVVVVGYSFLIRILDFRIVRGKTR